MATENILNLLSEETFAEKMDNLILAVHGISANGGGDVSITTWKQVQQLVRAGLARKYFSVGDKFIASKETAVNATSSNSSLTVSVNAITFIQAEHEAGNKDYEFTYDGIEWHDQKGNPTNMASYGITISGTPLDGDKIVVHETANDIEFLIMGFDQETPSEEGRTHSMTLAMKHTFTGVQFDEREAFFYNGTGSAMNAGTYNFKLGAHSWYSRDVGKYIQFTLSNPLPAGGQLVFKQAYNASLIGGAIKSYSSGDARTESPIEQSTMSEGQGGTYLGELKNGFNSEGTYAVFLNHCQRSLLGNNRWRDSAIRQWCNSDGAKATFWKAKNGWDRQPSWFSSLDGFLYGIDSDLESVIGVCDKDVELASCDGSGHETTKDRVWLFDRYEIQSCTQSEASSYRPYEYWHALIGETYGDWRTDSRFIKTNKSGSAQYWWLRSPYVGSGNYARNVYTSGFVSYDYAGYGIQAVVAFAVV